jgi:hypothetical protein
MNNNAHLFIASISTDTGDGTDDRPLIERIGDKVSKGRTSDK